MKIFLVTPSFNSEKTIEQTLASVLNQFHPESIHYHVQDGGSQDSTIAILEAWKMRFRNRGISFSFCSENDGGMYEAIVKGFDKFRPEDNDWMAWINSDDQLSGLFSYTLHKMQKSIFWITGKPAIIQKNGTMTTLDRYYSTELVSSGLCNGKNWFFVQQEGTAWRYAAWRSTHSASTLVKYKYAGDFHLWVNLAKKYELFQCSYPMGFFNIRDGQASQAFWDKYVQEMLETSPETSQLCKKHKVNYVSSRNKEIELNVVNINISSNKEYQMESYSV
ncbi:glycosyltransferase [Chitinibacter sp. SCUT-21]|uniref:glycosyltransferase n=1 Tax=Chitinibacter sp. SCUT-21 TaxID=2970891 RepID=UPI0035A6FFBF